ncbi:MAG: methylmalonyl-CoA mutase [Deltaproteobacteria bacterium]|jgi:methylmalonyl-CoA mutase N-terminal domain/subunit|nr:methylmalonyl-CoA mutase [Deltaproteobacteria bacterium]MBW2542559.1 methylmalonyl-CoA mutase [Deltaproteobacteria bacterium]
METPSVAATPVKPTANNAGDPQTISGRPVKAVYGPEDLADFDPATALGAPGAFPFTRGPHREMYRKQFWTMRQFAGFGTPAQTNERFHYLLAQGQMGLSTAFDLPTLMGRDSDDPLSRGEVGRCGVAIDTLADFERLYRGVDLGAISISMTINAPAAVLLAFYVALADKTGVPRDRLRGTCQNDILKEFHAQNEFVFPPRPSLKLVVDTIEFATQELPQYNPVSISGYHIREAGSTAGQELAFTLADGMAYVEAAIEAGNKVDDFAPRLSFFFNCHNDFLEEIAKYRAARRVWAKLMRDRFGAKDARSQWLRFHAQTAGCTLWGTQPMVNVVRVAYQALAAVLGGCQSLHTNSMDETLALPTAEAATLALRTQQVLAHETGVTNTVDPLGGSYAIETLTNELEAEAWDYFERIEQAGGVLAATESGFFRREIAESAFRYSQQMDRNEHITVGVNAYREEAGTPIETLKIDPSVETEQIQALARVREVRDATGVETALEALRRTAAAGDNVMPALIDAAKAHCSVGETVAALADVYGRFDGGVGW